MDATEKETEIHTGGGPAVQGDVTAGRNWIGRDSRRRRDSHNVTINLENWQALENQIMQMEMDIKLLIAIGQERSMQIERLQNRVMSIDRAMFAMAIAFAIFVWFTWR